LTDNDHNVDLIVVHIVSIKNAILSLNTEVESFLALDFNSQKYCFGGTFLHYILIYTICILYHIYIYIHIYIRIYVYIYICIYMNIQGLAVSDGDVKAVDIRIQK
jgi:hypothetical protein